jgi:quinoprotein glucose dehydrogenase
MSLVPPPPGFTDLDYIVGRVGQRVTMINAAGADQGADVPLKRAAAAPPPPAAPARSRALTVEGLPLVKPPYSTISAIDLDSGKILWQVPHGETPDAIRNNPALKGVTIPRTGQTGFNIGTLVTKDLVIAGDATATTTPDHPRGAMLRAYDQKTGTEVGHVLMPSGQSGSPMTYMLNGKQYIMVAISGGDYSGEYICYTLPGN